MKKIFLFLVLMVAILPLIVLADETYYINNGKTQITAEEYNNLLNLGFEDYEIYGMSLEMFNENRDLRGEIIKKVTYDMSEFPQLSLNPDESIGGGIANPNNYGYCETEYKKMTVYIISVSTYYRYKVTLLWKQIPRTRSWDIIALSHETNVKLGHSAFFEQAWCKSGECMTSQDGNFYSYDNVEIVTFKLPSGTLTSLNSFLYYPVLRVNSNEVIDTITTIGDYAHATSTISRPLSKSEIGWWYEIRIPENATKYDDIMAVDITKTVNWGA